MKIFLLIDAVFLLGAIIFGGSAVYHARRFGLPGDKTSAATLLYLVAITVIIIGSVILIGSTDFSGEAA